MRAQRAINDAGPIERMDASNAAIGRAERDRLRAIYECDLHDLWHGSGHRNHAEFLAGRYGITKWKARRLIGAAYALEYLPLTSHALTTGSLSLEKILELSRFATPRTERKLISWAKRVSTTGIRDRADEQTRPPAVKQEIELARTLEWWWHDDGSMLEIQGHLPPADGASFVAAVDALAEKLPTEPPGEGKQPTDDELTIDQRRADALVLLTTGAEEKGGARNTVVAHAPMDVLIDGHGTGVIAGGPAIDATTLQRLACEARIEIALYGKDGNCLGIGRDGREPPPWLRRQVLRRDSHACTFTGCAMKRFLHVHHILWWERGGPTDLDNLITVCSFHHKLVHEHGWSVTLGSSGEVTWFRPSGRRFEPGPAPPVDVEPEPMEQSHDEPALRLAGHFLENNDYAVTKERALVRILKWGTQSKLKETVAGN